MIERKYGARMRKKIFMKKYTPTSNNNIIKRGWRNGIIKKQSLGEKHEN